MRRRRGEGEEHEVRLRERSAGAVSLMKRVVTMNLSPLQLVEDWSDSKRNSNNKYLPKIYTS